MPTKYATQHTHDSTTFHILDCDLSLNFTQSMMEVDINRKR